MTIQTNKLKLALADIQDRQHQCNIYLHRIELECEQKQEKIDRLEYRLNKALNLPINCSTCHTNGYMLKDEDGLLYITCMAKSCHVRSASYKTKTYAIRHWNRLNKPKFIK